MRYPHSPIRTVPQHRAGRTPGAPTRDLGEQGTDTGLQGGGDRGHGAGDEMAEGRTNCWSCTKSFQGNVLLQHVHLTMTCATWGRPHGDMDHMHHGSMSWGGCPKGPRAEGGGPTVSVPVRGLLALLGHNMERRLLPIAHPPSPLLQSPGRP